MTSTLSAALAAALVVPSPVPATVAIREPAAIVAPSKGPTTTEKASLAALSLVDFFQTSRWLRRDLGPNRVPPRENDPLLGLHPSLARMALTGVALDEAVLHVRSPFLRRFAISLEAGNVARNFAVMGFSL